MKGRIVEWIGYETAPGLPPGQRTFSGILANNRLAVPVHDGVYLREAPQELFVNGMYVRTPMEIELPEAITRVFERTPVNGEVAEFAAAFTELCSTL